MLKDKFFKTKRERVLMKKISSSIFNIWLFRIPLSGNLSITYVDVLVEDIILESDEASGGVGTAQDITPDIIKGAEVGVELVQNIQLPDCVFFSGTCH